MLAWLLPIEMSDLGWLVAPVVSKAALAPGSCPEAMLTADRCALTVLAEAGSRSAGCAVGVMPQTGNECPAQGGRVDHVVSPLLAASVVPHSYAVHVSEIGNRAIDIA